MKQVKRCEGRIGTQLDPHPAGCLEDAWKRSAFRHGRANSNARIDGRFPARSSKGQGTHYRPYHDPESPVGKTFATQCTAPIEPFRR